MKILAWDAPTRTFHWLLALSFLGAYLSGEADGYRALHVIFGYSVALLVGFRLAWFVVGTRYARISGFALSPRAALEYARSLLTRSPQHFIGHNPLGSWAALALIGLLAVVAATGIGAHLELNEEVLEDVHEAAANLALALVVLHIAAVVLSSFLHRENLVRAMLAGTKDGDPSRAAAGPRVLVAVVLLVTVLAFWGGAFELPGMGDNPGVLSAALHPQPRENDD